MLKFVRLGLKFDYDRYYAKKDNESVGIIYGIHPLLNCNSINKFFFKLFSSSKFFLSSSFTKKYCCRQYLRSLSNYIDENDNLVFILNETSDRFLNVDLVSFLKAKYKNSSIVYEFPDKVEMYQKWIKKFEINAFLNLFSFSYTYNAIDSKEYGIPLAPPKVPIYCCDNDGAIEYDVFYVGKNKGRMEKLIDLYDRLTKYGLKCLFLISNVEYDSIVCREGIVYNKKISYLENLEYVKKSKSIVNIVQEGASGVTLRDCEAIGLNKILITNSSFLKMYNFYTESKVVFVGNLEKEIFKITELVPSDKWQNKEKYSPKSFYNWIASCLGKAN